MASCLIQLLNTNSESAGIRVLKLRGEVSNKENKLITIKFYQNHLCYFGIAYTPNITNAARLYSCSWRGSWAFVLWLADDRIVCKRYNIECPAMK